MGCLHRVGHGGDTIGINTEEIVASPTPEEKIPDSLGVCAAKTRISRMALDDSAPGAGKTRLQCALGGKSQVFSIENSYILGRA